MRKNEDKYCTQNLLEKQQCKATLSDFKQLRDQRKIDGISHTRSEEKFNIANESSPIDRTNQTLILCKSNADIQDSNQLNTIKCRITQVNNPSITFENAFYSKNKKKQNCLNKNIKFERPIMNKSSMNLKRFSGNLAANKSNEYLLQCNIDLEDEYNKVTNKTNHSSHNILVDSSPYSRIFQTKESFDSENAKNLEISNSTKLIDKKKRKSIIEKRLDIKCKRIQIDPQVHSNSQIDHNVINYYQRKDTEPSINYIKSFVKDNNRVNQSEIRSNSFILKKSFKEHFNMSQDNCKTPLMDFKFQKPKNIYLPYLVKTFQSNAKRIAEKWHRINSNESYRKHLTYSLSPESNERQHCERRIETERSQDKNENYLINLPQTLSQRRTIYK